MSVEVTALDNGLRIVTETRRSVETVAVGVWVDVGARYETVPENGLTHFLEHMLFKGTKKRSARAIAYEIEAVGGHMNAYTSRDNTTYYARVLKDDMPLAVELLADLVQNSVFDPTEIEREKEVVLQEIGQTLDTPDDIVFDNLQAVSFSDQPIGRSILGEAENVRAFSRDHLLNFLDTHYAPQSIVISAVGNLEHAAVVEEVSKQFRKLSTQTRAAAPKAHYTGGRSLVARKLEQVHVTLGWEGVSFHNPEYYAYQLYSTILGGGMSSRLFQSVREEQGLAYSVYSFASSHTDTGLFGIYAGTGAGMVAELLPLIEKEMAELTHGPTEEEFALARAQLKSGLLMALEATTSRMEQLGRQLLIFDRIITADEMISNIEAVSSQDIAKVAQAIQSASRTSVAAIGDHEAIDWFSKH